MGIRELCIQHPLLVSTSINAARASRNYRRMYDEEVEDPNSVFAEQPGESIEDRLWLSNQHPVDVGMERKHAYIAALKYLAALSYKVSKYEATINEHLQQLTLIKELSELEPNFPDVASILTVQEAAMILTWSGVAVPIS